MNHEKEVYHQFQKASINIYYQNVRGIRSKHKKFHCNSTSFDYSIVALTETWLNSSFYSSEYFDKSYLVYRTDRKLNGSATRKKKKKKGGGTLIAVHNSFMSSAIRLDGHDDIEYTCVEIRRNAKSKLFIYVAYIPPSSPAELYEKHLSAIKSIHLEHMDSIFVIGDFNIPLAEWMIPDENSDENINEMIPINVKPSFAADFLHGVLSQGYNQVNTITNNMNRLLDLAFTNDSMNVEVTNTRPLTKIDPYHPPLLFIYESHFNSKIDTGMIPRHNFARADYMGMCNFLNDSNITENIENKSLNDKITYLYDVLNEGISQFVPLIKRKKFKIPWWDKELQKLKNRKNKEWKRFKMTGEKSAYDNVFAEFDALNSLLYENHVAKLKSSLKHNPSSFWNLVNSKRNADHIPKLLHNDSRSSMDEFEQATMFAEFFSSNFNSNSTIPDMSTIVPQNPIPSECLVLDEYFVFDQLLKIKTTTSAGPDGIHPLILKNCASILYIPLTLIFNQSLETGHFPDIWKRYSVRPIFKKGLRSNINNYRCIAKLKTIAKFFEHCVNVHLTRIVSTKISPNQHGFIKHRSTTTNLMDFLHYSINGLNEYCRVDALYLDFSKAFDKVNHEILMRKLSSYSIPLNILKWIKSYLSNRRQYVKLGVGESADFIVNSGIPQGSHIGPTIFLLFINDLPSIVTDEVFLSMFADDVRVAKTITNSNDSMILQSAIDNIQRWCDTNDLYLNLDKCSVLSIHRGRAGPVPFYYLGDHLIATTNEQRDLGVIIDDRLSFKSHIDMIISKANSALGFVKRFCYDIDDQSTLKAVYSAFVQSNLDYCSTLWLTIPSTRSNAIESIPRQFTMFALHEYPNVANNYQIASYEDRLNRLKMTKLDRRRINTALIFLYDLINNNIHCPLVKELFYINPNIRNFRNAEMFKIKDSKLSRTISAPITQICKYANLIKDLFIEASSRNNFKKLLYKLNDDIFFF